jgi:hypothetical protein
MICTLLTIQWYKKPYRLNFQDNFLTIQQAINLRISFPVSISLLGLFGVHFSVCTCKFIRLFDRVGMRYNNFHSWFS